MGGRDGSRRSSGASEGIGDRPGKQKESRGQKTFLIKRREKMASPLIIKILNRSSLCFASGNVQKFRPNEVWKKELRRTQMCRRWSFEGLFWKDLPSREGCFGCLGFWMEVLGSGEVGSGLIPRGTGPRASWSPSWVKGETSALHIRLSGARRHPSGHDSVSKHQNGRVYLSGGPGSEPPPLHTHTHRGRLAVNASRTTYVRDVQGHLGKIKHA